MRRPYIDKRTCEHSRPHRDRPGKQLVPPYSLMKTKIL